MSRKLATCLSALLLSLLALPAQADGNSAAFNLALKSYQEKEWWKAKLLFEKSLEFNPKDALSIYYLAQIEMKYGFSTHTLQLLNAAYRADPEGEAGLEAYAQEKELRAVIRKEQSVALETFQKDKWALELNVFSEKPNRVSLFTKCIKLAEPTQITEFEIGKRFKVSLAVTTRLKNRSVSKSVTEKEAYWDVSDSHPKIIVDEGMMFEYNGVIVDQENVGTEWKRNIKQFYFAEIGQKADLIDWEHRSDSQYTFRPGRSMYDYCFLSNE